MSDPTQYDINTTTGTLLTSVLAVTKDDSTCSITLLGPQVPNYGEYLNENQVHILENFAGTSAPGSLPLDPVLKSPPLIGQLWFDTDAIGPFSADITSVPGRLKHWDGTVWEQVVDNNDLVLEKNARTSADSSMLSTINSNTASISGKVNKAGDTMTGFLILPADPTSALHAATKQYVDNRNVRILSAYFDDSSGTANFATAASEGSGITSIVLESTGRYKVAFTVPFTHIRYSVSVQVHNNTTGAWWVVDEIDRQTDSYSFTAVKFAGTITGVATNAAVSIQIFGK